MAVEQSTSEAPAKAALWRRPVFRSTVFQVLLILAVVYVGNTLFNNTLHNLEQRGISTGFGFLDNEAGFGIVQSLIDYKETDTFGRTFLVGLVNTILVSFLGILLATLIGFMMGVARLSKNWLIAKLAMVYIETFRNIPLLLQIMFWYFIVLNKLPGPRQSHEFAGTVFLNKRGLYLPAPVFESGFWLVSVAIVVAIVVVFFMVRWAHARQDRTGEQFHSIYYSLAILLGIPLLVFLAVGAPLSWELPALRGFNFSGGLVVIPELAALLLALSIYTAAFIAEAVRSGILAVSHGQTEAAYALGLRPGVTLRLVIIPQALRVIIPQLTSQ